MLETASAPESRDEGEWQPVPIPSAGHLIGEPEAGYVRARDRCLLGPEFDNRGG